VYNKIIELNKDGHKDVEGKIIKLENIAVLARNRYVLSKVEEVFLKNGVNHTVRTSYSNTMNSESTLIHLFELGLKLIVNCKNTLVIKEIKDIVNQTNLKDFESIKEYLYAKEDNLYKLLVDVWNMIDINDEINLLMILNKFDNQVSSIEDDNERLMISNDILTWKCKWEKFLSRTLLGDRKIDNFLRSISMGELNDHNTNGVVLSTVHMAKGLEFDVVFIIGMNDGVFPDYRSVRKYEYDNDDSDIKEEKHNLFVAITRSKRLCYITYPDYRDTPWGRKKQDKSRFLNYFDGK
jgi:DNA helicase-2/ATP-dependent DNA helicase PcrA